MEKKVTKKKPVATKKKAVVKSKKVVTTKKVVTAKAKITAPKKALVAKTKIVAKNKVTVKKSIPAVKSNESIDKNFFAVLRIKGEQIKLYKNEEVEVNHIKGKVGEKIEIVDVLLVSDGDKVEIGKPIVKDATALIEIIEQKKGPKLKTIFFKAKSRYRKHYGARQFITVVRFLGLK